MKHLLKFFSLGDRSQFVPVCLLLGCGFLGGCALPEGGVASRLDPLRIDFRPPADRVPDESLSGLAAGGPDDVARFLAGMSNRLRADFRNSAQWEEHQRQMDVRWTRAEGRLTPIRAFQRRELAGQGNGHVFYPFGGPDFLYANAFFPNAGTYTLVGLEEIGPIPNLAGLSESQIATSLRGLQTSISSSLDYSYFLTKDMRLDLASTSLKGVLPVLYVYLARSGHRIYSVDDVHLTASGQIAAGRSGSAPGVRLRCSGCTVYYFRTNLANSGSGRFIRYMANNAPGTTFLKSASYLMHSGEFSNIRGAILNHSKAVLQDASGVPFRYFGRDGWEVALFGNYVRTLDMFKAHYQPDLRQAYLRGGSTPLDFGVGYTFTPEETCLILAKRVRPNASASAAVSEERPPMPLD